MSLPVDFTVSSEMLTGYTADRRRGLKIRLDNIEKLWLMLIQDRWDMANVAQLTSDSAELADAARAIKAVDFAKLAAELQEQLNTLRYRAERPQRRHWTKITVLLTKLRLALLDVADMGALPSAVPTALPAVWLLGTAPEQTLANRLNSAGFKPWVVHDLNSLATLYDPSRPPPLALILDLESTGLETVTRAKKLLIDWYKPMISTVG